MLMNEFAALLPIKLVIRFVRIAAAAQKLLPP